MTTKATTRTRRRRRRRATDELQPRPRTTRKTRRGRKDKPKKLVKKKDNHKSYDTGLNRENCFFCFSFFCVFSGVKPYWYILCAVGLTTQEQQGKDPTNDHNKHRKAMTRIAKTAAKEFFSFSFGVAPQSL